MAPPHNPSFILAFTDIKRGFKNSFIESLIVSPPDSGGRAFLTFYQIGDEVKPLSTNEVKPLSEAELTYTTPFWLEIHKTEAMSLALCRYSQLTSLLARAQECEKI